MPGVQDAQSRIAEYRRRPGLYRNVDGTEEINIGMMGLFGFLGWWLLPRGWSFPLFVVILAFCRYMPRWVKNRYTYPRTGFVEPACSPGKRKATRVLSLFVGAAVAAGIALSFSRRISGEVLIVPAIGILMGVGYARGYGRMAAWKQVVAAAVALCGIATAFLPDQIMPAHRRFAGSLILYFMSSGTILLISGLVTLFGYIRATRSVETAE